MSLVEQAIARLKKAAPQGSPPAAPTSAPAAVAPAPSPVPAPVPVPVPISGPSASHSSTAAGPATVAHRGTATPAPARGARDTLVSRIAVPLDEESTANFVPRIHIDAEALRAEGYLPEVTQERRFNEHFRHIKRPLIDAALTGSSTADGVSRRLIMVTSALPGDGKTFTTINLAFSMAKERDVSVLLIDCDGLKRHISEIFGVLKEPGMMDALIDESLNIESLVLSTNVRGLSILPSGRLIEGTAELYSSNRMRLILNQLITQSPRRVVLIDSPPLLITNEGRVLVKSAGQVALVVRAGKTPQHAVRDAVGMVDKEQAGGIVVNQGHGGFSEDYYGYGAYGTDTNETAAPKS